VSAVIGVDDGDALGPPSLRPCIQNFWQPVM